MNLSLRLIAYALVFVGAADAPLFAAEKSAKPNLVIILADDQGWGDLSLNGNTNLRTGDYEAAVHYTCPEADAGSAIELSFNGSKLEGKVSPAWNPPLLDKQDPS